MQDHIFLNNRFFLQMRFNGETSLQQLKKNFLQRLSMCVALLRIEGDLEKALYSWVKLWKPKRLLDLYEQSPERFAKLPKGNKSILYRQISLPAKMFDKLLHGSKIKGKRALESWSENQNISSEFNAKRNDFIVTFKKNIPKDQHVVHVPSISLGFNNSNFANESSLEKNNLFGELKATHCLLSRQAWIHARMSQKISKFGKRTVTDVSEIDFVYDGGEVSPVGESGYKLA